MKYRSVFMERREDRSVIASDAGEDVSHYYRLFADKKTIADFYVAGERLKGDAMMSIIVNALNGAAS
jgi:hypothetical protein